MRIESDGVLELNRTTNLTFDQTNQHLFVYFGAGIYISSGAGFDLPYVCKIMLVCFGDETRAVISIYTNFFKFKTQIQQYR